MVVRFATDVRDGAAVDLRAALNAALGSAATIDFFDGTAPVTCEAADAGTLLCSMPLDDPVFDTVIVSTFNMNAIAPGTVSTGGTATYWRMKDSGGTCFIQGLCSDSAFESILFNETTWSMGQSIAIDFLIFNLTLVGTP